MEPKGGGKNHTQTKPPSDPSMTYKESEDMLFRDVQFRITD